jgi:excisionase family DNA binding protein
MHDAEQDALLTTKQAAEALTLDPGTLEVWRSKKRYDLPYVKIGSKVRYRQSAIQKFLESRTVKA